MNELEREDQDVKIVPLIFTDEENMNPHALYQDLGQRLEGAKGMLVILLREDDGEDIVMAGHTATSKLKLMAMCDMAKQMVMDAWVD